MLLDSVGLDSWSGVLIFEVGLAVLDKGAGLSPIQLTLLNSCLTNCNLNMLLCFHNGYETWNQKTRCNVKILKNTVIRITIIHIIGQ